MNRTTLPVTAPAKVNSLAGSSLMWQDHSGVSEMFGSFLALMVGFVIVGAFLFVVFTLSQTISVAPSSVLGWARSRLIFQFRIRGNAASMVQEFFTVRQLRLSRASRNHCLNGCFFRPHQNSRSCFSDAASRTTSPDLKRCFSESSNLPIARRVMAG